MEEKKAHFFTHRECEYFPCGISLIAGNKSKR